MRWVAGTKEQGKMKNNTTTASHTGRQPTGTQSKSRPNLTKTALGIAGPARPRWLDHAWKAIVVVDIGILAWGLMAALNPSLLTEGFETFTDRTWATFAAGDGQAGDFILAGFRLVGVFNITVAITLIAIAAKALRYGQRWAWWTILVGNTMAITAPIVYDQYVGYIGPFEVLEYVGLLATYGALAATSSVLRSEPDQMGLVPARW
jgi:hypothetical protein